MKRETEAQLLRIFLNSNDQYKGRPVGEAIVAEAHKRGLSGATMVRGIMGFGESGQLHSVAILSIVEQRPVVVEIVDQPDKIAGFLPVLQRMNVTHYTTVNDIRMIVYRKRDKS